MRNQDIYIGILSGTSMDSIDCVLCDFKNEGYNIIEFIETPYPKALKEKLKSLNENELKHREKVDSLDIELSKSYVKLIEKIIKKANKSNEEILVIGMHGQTVSHLVDKNSVTSIQIGSPQFIAESLKIDVAANFRQDDISDGGQGAPLAPLFHEYIFNKHDKNQIVANIGGISNISLLPAAKKEVIGYDTGPGNVLIDKWIQKKYGMPYDKDGEISNSVKFSDKLLNIFLNDNYFLKQYPKSVGAEYFSLNWIEKNINKMSKTEKISPEVVTSTLTKLTSKTIVDQVKNNMASCDEIIIVGGGAYNKSIISNIEIDIEENFGKKTIVCTSKNYGFNPKTIEAGLFAWLAMCKLNNTKLDYRSITGSSSIKTIGKIY
ncbi:MAG: anhydro-N-acetylmuramic acid kinase [Pseudomonadota bacterium]|nr:anhydro-N-acetylmuramic acid kinase [Pseudomonadota bacterium]